MFNLLYVLLYLCNGEDLLYVLTFIKIVQCCSRTLRFLERMALVLLTEQGVDLCVLYTDSAVMARQTVNGRLMVLRVEDRHLVLKTVKHVQW